MKIKEKLARDNCADNLGDKDAMSSCMLCYLAGFEKAREMAAALLSEYSSVDDEVTEGRELVGQTKRLGEEEEESVE